MRNSLLALVLAASTLVGSAGVSGCATPDLDEDVQPEVAADAGADARTADARTEASTSSDGSPATDSGTTNPGADAAAAPDPCAAANLIGCFTFESIPVEDRSPTKLVSSYAQGITLGAGRSGMGLQTEPVTNLRFTSTAAFGAANATVDAFIKISGLPATTQIIFDADGRYAMGITPTGAVLCQANPSGVSGGTVTVGQWVHVACALGGGQVRVFVDGVLATQGGGGVGGDNGQIAIAGDAPNGDNRFSGSIDTLRIFDVTRSATEIAADAK